ncbi:MAG: SPOR domain-containing protein [Pseudomonadota bacterium]
MAQNRFSGLSRLGCAAALLVTGTWVAAQVPEPLPPQDYAEDEYIDASGCVFVRFVLDGQTGWAARLSENGAQICGLSDVSLSGQSADVSGTPRDPVFAKPGIYVQVGAFGGNARAQAAMDQLAGLALPALRLDMDWSPPITIVYAGPFSSEDDAAAARESVQSVGYIDAFQRVQE